MPKNSVKTFNQSIPLSVDCIGRYGSYCIALLGPSCAKTRAGELVAICSQPPKVTRSCQGLAKGGFQTHLKSMTVKA